MDEYKKLTVLAIILTTAVFVAALAVGYYIYSEVGAQILIEREARQWK